MFIIKLSEILFDFCMWNKAICILHTRTQELSIKCQYHTFSLTGTFRPFLLSLVLIASVVRNSWWGDKLWQTDWALGPVWPPILFSMTSGLHRKMTSVSLVHVFRTHFQRSQRWGCFTGQRLDNARWRMVSWLWGPFGGSSAFLIWGELVLGTSWKQPENFLLKFELQPRALWAACRSILKSAKWNP